MGPDTILLTLASAQWLISWPLVLRLREPVRSSEVTGTSPAASLSIIIPARNEAGNLPVLLDSLAAQEIRPHEILVIDDHSTDATAEIALRYGATVIPSSPLPAGLRGKPWACAQGAEAATGELLMFLDADCRFEPDGLRPLLALHPGGAFSVLPWHELRRPYEQLSALFNVIMAAGSLPTSLMGQCLLVSRQDYDLSGGHLAVGGEIIENAVLTREFRRAGIPVSSIPGRGLLTFRMYPDGMSSLVEGWTKGFSQGARLVSRSTLIEISAWIGGLITAAAGVASLPWMDAAQRSASGPWLAVVYLAFASQLALMLRRVGNYSLLAAFLYPLPLAFYLIVFVRSLGRAGKEATWKGRRLHVD